jgi:alpha-ketoglutarate-dependent taurine dioxygenase
MRGMDAPAFPFLHHDFGIEILDIDLQEQLSESAWQSLRDALAQHALLVLRKQKLSHEAMELAALRFGARHGEIQRVETRGPSEHQEWHSALAQNGGRVIATVLCAREAPPQDGGMEFASMRVGQLKDIATQPERIYHHDFRPDDVLIWNNTALMHRACALRAGERRLLEVVSVLAA